MLNINVKDRILTVIKKLLLLIPDSLYLRLIYRIKMKKNLNLNNPKTFNEKIQWLKLYDRKPFFTNLVDKIEVKRIVSDKIGAHHVLPTLGIWGSFDEIQWDSLPDQFVLKTNHGGGSTGVVICKSKKKLDIENARIKLEHSLRTDAYTSLREWPYKDIKRKIFAEKYIEVPDKTDLTDYKFFCFNGEPRFLKVDFNRFVEHHANYYDLDWNLLPFGEADFPPIESHIEHCPLNFDKMIAIARQLSSGHPFLRVDLYNIAGRIYFGELTFYPASGLGAFTSNMWDEKIGNLLQIPS